MKHAIEELRFLTILFADLSGFTALSQSLDPEEVREAIGICFERLNPIITRQGGIIHKYEGDLIIAFFGYPSAHEDDPERSVKVALDMMQDLPGINERLGARFRIPKQIGLHVGVSSGTVFVGEIGSKEKKEYTVMGEVVNLAARLKDTARNGEVLVSETVYRLTRYLFDYEKLPAVSMKGIEEEVKIFRPVRLKEKPEPKRGIRGLSSPLFGRDLELYLLQNRLQGLAIGWGGALFITGYAGIGKSRLWSEVRNATDTGNGSLAIHEGRCESSVETAAYLPFRQIIRSLMGFSETDPPADIQTKIMSGILALFPDKYLEIVPYVGHLFSIHFTADLDEKIKYLDPRALKAQVMLSIKKMLGAWAENKPTVLVIENFQWIDPESRELIEYILSDPPDNPLLFVFLIRPEKDSDADRAKDRIRERLADNYTEIFLKPLEPAATASVLDHLLTGAQLPPSLRERILSRAEGNPFYLEEIIRNLIDKGVIYRAASGIPGTSGWTSEWKVSSDSDRFVIPENIQFLITSGLDRLEPEVKEVLQRASVLGRIFDIDVLERMTGAENLILSLHLATLEEEELIRRGSGEDKRYRFRHPLIHEVAYHSLLKKKRRELHRLAAEFYVTAESEPAIDHCEAIATHYANSDQPEKAIEWLMKAGARAREQFAYDEALGHYRRIAAILGDEGVDSPSDLRIAYEKIGDIMNLKGDYEPALENFQKAFELARDPVDKIRMKTRLAYVNQILGRTADALKCYAEAEETPKADSRNAVYEKINARISRCSVYRVMGDVERSRRECQEAMLDLEKLDCATESKTRLRIKAFNNLGLTSWVLGDNARAIEYFNQGIKISEAAGDKRNLGIACNNLGVVYQHQGEYGRANELFFKHMTNSQSMGNMRSTGIAVSNLAEVAFWQGNYEKSEKYYDEFFKIFREVGSKIDLGMAYGYLALIARDRGDQNRAREYMTKCVELNRTSGNRLEYACALCFQGWLSLDENDLTGSETSLADSERIFREISSKTMLVLNCCLRVGLSLKKGDPIDVSLKYANQAWQFAEETDSSSGRAQAFYAYGRIYQKWGETAKAELNFQKAREILARIGQRKTLADVLWELSLNHETRGQKAEARDAREQALQLYSELKVKGPEVNSKK